MKKNRFFLINCLFIALVTFFSCSDELETSNPGENLPAPGMLSNIPDEYEDGWIRVKFSGISEETNDGQTLRSAFDSAIDPAFLNVPEIKELAEWLGATEIRRVFAEGGKYKERRRAAGLHLWYDFYVGDDMPAPSELRSSFFYPYYVELVELIPVYRQFSNPEDASRANNSQLRASQAIPTTTFNDPLLSRQWHYQNDGTSSDKAKIGADINLFSAWQITTGNPKVIVAIMDGGVDYTHPDIARNMWINTAEYNGNPGEDSDGNGYVDDIYGYRWGSSSTPAGGGDIKPMDHGTHCAGTVAAVNNNGVGGGGVAGGNGNANSGVRIMSCQTYVPDPAYPDDPYGNSKSTSQTPDAFAYAADNGAVIVNCSFTYSGTSLSAAYKAGIDYFVNNAGNYSGSPMKGGLVVGAAGNDGEEISKYPASYEKCISVAYMTSDFVKSSSSNFGSWIDITAPGGATSSSYAPNKVGGVFSTVPMASGNYDVQQGYGYKSGTSMAAPHIAGVAALIVSAMVEKGVTDFTVEKLRDALLRGTRNIDQYNETYAGKLGAGYCDARLALDFALGNKVDIPGVELASTTSDLENITVRWRVPSGLQGNAPKSFILLFSKSSLEGVDYDNPGSDVTRVLVENDIVIDQYISHKFKDLEPGTTYNIGILTVYSDNLRSDPCLLTAQTDSPEESPVSFVLTPTTVKNNLYIQVSSNPTSPVSVKIFNAVGNKILGKNMTLTTQTAAVIDMSKLSPGVYSVVITYEGVEYKYNIAKN